MSIHVDLDLDGLSLISSGSLLLEADQTVRMAVVIAEEKTVTVVLRFFQKKHPDGVSMTRRISQDGTIDEWSLFEADNDFSMIKQPVSVLRYVEGTTEKTVYFQIYKEKLFMNVDSMIKVEYWWFQSDREEGKIGFTPN